MAKPEPRSLRRDVQPAVGCAGVLLGSGFSGLDGDNLALPPTWWAPQRLGSAQGNPAQPPWDCPPRSAPCGDQRGLESPGKMMPGSGRRSWTARCQLPACPSPQEDEETGVPLSAAQEEQGAIRGTRGTPCVGPGLGHAEAAPQREGAAGFGMPGWRLSTAAPSAGGCAGRAAPGRAVTHLRLRPLATCSQGCGCRRLKCLFQELRASPPLLLPIRLGSSSSASTAQPRGPGTTPSVHEPFPAPLASSAVQALAQPRQPKWPRRGTGLCCWCPGSHSGPRRAPTAPGCRRTGLPPRSCLLCSWLRNFPPSLSRGPSQPCPALLEPGSLPDQRLQQDRGPVQFLAVATSQPQPEVFIPGTEWCQRWGRGCFCFRGLFDSTRKEPRVIFFDPFLDPLALLLNNPKAWRDPKPARTVPCSCCPQRWGAPESLGSILLWPRPKCRHFPWCWSDCAVARGPVSIF